MTSDYELVCCGISYFAFPLQFLLPYRIFFYDLSCDGVVVFQQKPNWNDQQSGWGAMKQRQPGGWGETNDWGGKVCYMTQGLVIVEDQQTSFSRCSLVRHFAHDVLNVADG